MHLLTLNAAGKQLAPPRTLDPRRRRLSQVVGRHVDRSRPFMLAVQRARDPLQPLDEAWITRGRDRAGKVKPWPRRYLPADAIVVVVYLPRGGGSSGGHSSTKGTVISIAALVAAVALTTFGGPLAIGALGPIFGPIALAGTVVGLTAIASLASRAKASKQATDTTQVYGVAGGGNLPKQGDRIPRGYGRSWMKPDLSQPDFSQYDGDDQILFKRHTIGLGRYRPYAVRAGKQVMWEEGTGFVAPFNDPRNAVEFIYGTPSTLVPSNVISAAGVGGQLARGNENPAFSGPFLINQRGALVSRLQIDFQFPQGLSRIQTLRSGVVQSNQPAAWSVVFQYAAIDETGAIVGPWLDLYNSNSGIEGARFATHPLRYTKFKDVPPGRYAVRGWNVQPDTSEHNGTGAASIDAVQWDAASGWVADQAVRDGVTEICLRFYATKGTQGAAFGEIEVDAGAILPVFDGASWSEQETSKAVWAFLDVMRNQDYGGAIPDSQLDLERARYYASTLTEFDTFDGTIRGPLSVFEAAATTLLPMRAEPVHLGRYWSLVRDEPKAVRRHLVSRRQIVKGSTQLVFDLDTAAGAGHVIGEFDQDGDYRAPNQVEQIFGEASLTPSRMRWTGVRDYAHARHLTTWRAACGAFRRQSAPIGVEMEGRIFKRGDALSIDTWFLDARRVAGVVDRAGDTLTLDAPVTVAAGDAAVLRDRTGREWGPVAIAAQSLDRRSIVLDATARAAAEQASGLALVAVLSDGRGEATTVLVGSVETLAENYLIQAIKPDGPTRAQVDALIDDPRVWEALGAPIVAPPTSGGGMADPESPHILGLTPNLVQVAAGFQCQYNIRPGRGCKSFEVGLSYDSGNRYDERRDAPVTGSIDLNPVDPTTVVLRARGFGAGGLPGPFFYANLIVPRAQLSDDMLTEVNEKLAAVDETFNEVGEHLRALDQTAADLLAANIKAVEEATAQLAASVTALRGEMADIAEAAATVEGAAYQRVNLIKASLQGRDQDAFAAIKREETARVTDIEALSYTSDLITARLGNAESAIQTEKTARETADTAIAEDVTTAFARLTTAETGISGLASGQLGLANRVTSTEGNISVLSQNYATLNAQILSAQGTITTQGAAISKLSTDAQSTATTLSSHSSSIVGLQNAINDPNTGLVANANAYSNLSSSVSSQGQQLNALGQNTAASFTSQGNSIVGLQNAINDPNTGLNANASAYSSLSTTVTQQGNQLSSVAQAANVLTSRVGNDSATVATVAGAYRGIGVEYAILGYIDNTRGGLVLSGAKKLDGSVQYQIEVLGDFVVDGTIYGQKLVTHTIRTEQLTTDQLIVNGHIFDNAISTVKGAEGSSASVSYTYTNARGIGTRLAIFAFFDSSGSGQFSNAAQCGNLQIVINGTVFKNVAAASFVANSNAYLISQAICKQIDVGTGTFTITVQHTNVYGYGKCDVLMMEISK